MNYERRLKAAAKLILLHDSGSDNSSVSSSDFGVTATLKPYQIDGVQWLIRRYHLGVNVILGYTSISFLGFIVVKWADDPRFSYRIIWTSFFYTLLLSLHFVLVAEGWPNFCLEVVDLSRLYCEFTSQLTISEFWMCFFSL